MVIRLRTRRKKNSAKLQKKMEEDIAEIKRIENE
jgi:hypothetical protein